MKKTLLIADPLAGRNGNIPATETAQNNFLREQLAKIFNLPADASEQDITTAASAAQEYNVNTKAQLAKSEVEEKLIAQKMDAGLSRDQAISVIKTQRKHDEAIARQWEERRPNIIKILKEGARENLKEREIRGLIREFNASITTDEINAARQSLEGNTTQKSD